MTQLPEWAPNIHPFFVYFPMPWWVAAVSMDLIALMLRKAVWANTAASVLYPAGAVSVIVAYLTGRQTAATLSTQGMAQSVVLEHWNWALVTTVAIGLIALFRFAASFRREHPSRWIRMALFAAALAAVVPLFEAGQRGARLVYDYGVGVSISGVAPPRR